MSERVEGTCLACGNKVSLANPDADRLREVEGKVEAVINNRLMEPLAAKELRAALSPPEDR